MPRGLEQQWSVRVRRGVGSEEPSKVADIETRSFQARFSTVGFGFRGAPPVRSWAMGAGGSLGGPWSETRLNMATLALWRP